MFETLLFQEALVAEVRPEVGARPECSVYRMSERKNKISLATLAFLHKRHPVRQGGQGMEVQRELMVWLMPRKAAEECVGVACSLLALLARVRTVLPSPRPQNVTRHHLAKAGETTPPPPQGGGEGEGAVREVCGAGGEVLPCARKEGERAVSEVCRDRQGPRR